MMTDLYQLTMAYGYWRNGIDRRSAVFDLFFRRNPFGGEYAIFAGLSEALRYLESLHFDDASIAWLKSLPNFSRCDSAFWEWLASLDASHLRVRAVAEGTPVFPRVPLIRVEGPLAIAQIVETTLLNIVNFSTLIATKAARMRHVAGDTVELMEFGLRRAQGPDGALGATRSAIIGGFDATSSVLAGRLLGIPVAGTHAHSYVQSFIHITPDLLQIADARGDVRDASALLEQARLEDGKETNEGELAAFLSYARALPDSTLLLVDTYDTLASGMPNAIRVFKILRGLGHHPIGIRLDSGDLGYLSREARSMLRNAGFGDLRIVASNSINESVLAALQNSNPEIDSYGVGTNLVTAEGDSALGGVYKLVEIDGQARMKISQDLVKVTIPGRKGVYRLRGAEGFDLADIMMLEDEAPPEADRPCHCRHPFIPEQQVRIVPSSVEELHQTVFENGRSLIPEAPVLTIRARSRESQNHIRPDHRRYLNPTPYKVSLSPGLFDYMYALWGRETALRTIR